MSEWKWTMVALGFLAALIVLLYFRARAQAKFLHNHINRKIDVVQKTVGEVKIVVSDTRQEARIATQGTREETMYLRAMVEGARKDSASAAEGMRTALHASEEASELRGEKDRSQNKFFQSVIFRQVAEWLKFVGGNHKDKP